MVLYLIWMEETTSNPNHLQSYRRLSSITTNQFVIPMMNKRRKNLRGAARDLSETWWRSHRTEFTRGCGWVWVWVWVFFLLTLTHTLNYVRDVRVTLDYLYENLRRTFINLILVLDVRRVWERNPSGDLCRLLHKKTCSWAAFPNATNSEISDRWIPLHHHYLLDLVNSDRHDRRDDFTVVGQPLMAHT